MEETFCNVKEEDPAKSICRLCFTECDIYRSIFETENASLHEWIGNLTTLKIIYISNAPASLCFECEETLQNFEAFREMCFANDVIIKEMFIHNDSKHENKLRGALSMVSEIKTEQSETQQCETTDFNVDCVENYDRDQQLNLMDTNDASADSAECINHNNIGKPSNDNVRKENSGCLARATTNKQKERHICHVCNKEFSHPTRLAKHVQRHTVERTYLCEDCGKSFITHGDLKRHARIHRDSTPNIFDNPPVELCDKTEASIKNKSTGKCYTNATLQLILDNVKNGAMTMYHAAHHYGIPRATIQYRLSSRFKNRGRSGPQTIFTETEEQDIINFAKDMERKGFPITRKLLFSKTSSLLKEHPRTLKSDTPGRKWLEGFQNRHKGFTVRTFEAVTFARNNVTKTDIRHWFQTIKSYLIENDLFSIFDDPSRILNGDEVKFCLKPYGKLVPGSKGNKKSSLKHENSIEYSTAMLTFSADGTMFPPNVILSPKSASKKMKQSIPKEWGLGETDNGLMDMENFILYMKEMVHPYLVQKGVKFPVIYFIDSFKSHSAIEAADACKNLGIILISLFPNATRLLPSAEVDKFKALTNSYTHTVDLWKLNEKDSSVSAQFFCEYLEDVLKTKFEQWTIIFGYAACGICPFNPNAVDYSKCTTNHACDETDPLEIKSMKALQFEKEIAASETIQENMALD